MPSTNPYSLAAALRVCQQCEATSPARDWQLVDRVTPDRCPLGGQVLVRLDGIPATDSRGRIAHMRGLYIHATMRVNVAGATNDPVTAYQARSVFPSINIRDVTGWMYTQDLDARSVLDDQYFRFGSMLQFGAMKSGIQIAPDVVANTAAGQGSEEVLDGGIPEDAGVGAYDVDVSWYFPFTGPSKNNLRGLIPVPALQRASSQAITIRIAQTFAGAPAGVALDELLVPDPVSGEEHLGFDVWADIIYLNGIVVDAPWQLSEYTMNELSGILQNPDRISEYAWIRYFPEDAAAFAGQPLVTTYDGITLTMAGMTNALSGSLIDDAVFRMLLDESVRNGWDNSLVRQNFGQSLPIWLGDTGPQALALLPYRDRRAAGAGPVDFRYNVRTPVNSRYLHRTVTCHSPNRAKRLEQSLKCGPCFMYGTDDGGKQCNGIKPYEPAIAIPQSMARRMSSR